MPATVFLLCPSCRFVIGERRDLEAISNSYEVETGPCAKCRDTQRRQAVTQAESERALDASEKP